jgi:hypothetical protein
MMDNRHERQYVGAPVGLCNRTGPIKSCCCETNTSLPKTASVVRQPGALTAKYSIMTSMPLESKRTSLLLLGITALACSRTLFFLFHDPEGPNLLIVTVLALILYGASFIAWRFIPATTGKKLLLAVCTQLLIVTGLYTIA